MSKYVILVLGVALGALLRGFLKKGCGDMTATLEKIKCVIIYLIYDEEVDVWIAMSEDVPGLVLESESKETLKKRVKLAAPELLELNGVEFDEDLLINFREVERVFG